MTPALLPLFRACVGRDAISARTAVLIAALLASVLTSLLVFVPDARFAYESPSMRVTVETAASLIALLAAQLVYGRFRRSSQLRDLVLSVALSVLAATNLLFGAIPAVVGDGPAGFETWAPVSGRFLGAALLVGAAFMPDRRVRRPRRTAKVWLCASMGILALGALLAVLSGDALPDAVPPGVSPEQSNRALIVGHPVVLTLQFLNMLLHASTAVGFTRRAELTSDTLFWWFGVGAAVGAFARLNYFLYPSLYSEWFYAGDILRLVFFLCLLAGGITEISRRQRALADAAVLDERRRFARDLHDGMAQDSAFIVQFGRAIARREDAPRGVEQIVTAAERALHDSRHAIAALVRPREESFGVALKGTAREAASREGADVRAALADVVLPEHASDALLRVAREAVSDAARHGGARTIHLELVDEPEVLLRITDDGEGFDVEAAANAPGRYGLTSMRERVDEVGGDLRIRSSPGCGSLVEVRLP